MFYSFLITLLQLQQLTSTKFIMAIVKFSVLSTVFKLLCLVGFVYQITEISLQYFAFKTSTKITFELDNKFIDPSVIFCTRYTDVIDRTNYQKYDIHPRRTYNLKEIFTDMTKLTVKDIFDLTPDPKEVIMGCQYRENDYRVKTLTRSQCYSRFHVVKYYEGAFICYQFRTKIEDSKFRYEEAALSYHDLNELYMFHLHPQFLSSNAIKLISFVPGGVNASVFNMPFVSRRFYVFRVRYGHDPPETSKINYLQVSGDIYSTKRLKKPYDTNCVENLEEAESPCRRRCNIASFRKHNLYPPNEFITEPRNIKPFNILILQNATILRDVKTRNDNCMRKCRKNSCNGWYSVSSLQSFPVFYNNSLSVGSICSNRPNVVIVHFPRISLMDLILYSSSSLGLWFGFSVLSMNPFQSNRCRRLCKEKQTTRSCCNKNDLCDVCIRNQATIQDLSHRMKRLENLLIH